MLIESNKNYRPIVFVLMPFSKSFDDIYKFGIKAACSAENAICERVDEQFFDGSILARIRNQIENADLIISDMTGRNPNVFYETGFAHGKDRKVILLTQNAKEIPFDLKDFPHIVYEGKITNLHNNLNDRMKWEINRIKEENETKILLTINGKQIIENTIIESFKSDYSEELKLKINVKNETYKPFKNQFTINLELPVEFCINNNRLFKTAFRKSRIIHQYEFNEEVYAMDEKIIDLRIGRAKADTLKLKEREEINACFNYHCGKDYKSIPIKIIHAYKEI